MAVFSLLSSSTPKLFSLHNSLILLPCVPYRRRISIAGPPRHRGRSPILSGMQQSVLGNSPPGEQYNRSSTISSTGNSLTAQSKSTTSGLNLQMFSLDNIPPWAKFVLGSLVLLAISFSRKSMRVRDVMKTVGTVVETVETVAEETEKVALEVAQLLPNGWLKEAAIKLEKIALFVDKSAEVTECVIDKVEDVVEVLDTNLKPEMVEEDGKKVNGTTNVIISTESNLHEVIIGGLNKLNGGEEEDHVF